MRTTLTMDDALFAKAVALVEPDIDKSEPIPSQCEEVPTP